MVGYFCGLCISFAVFSVRPFWVWVPPPLLPVPMSLSSLSPCPKSGGLVPSNFTSCPPFPLAERPNMPCHIGPWIFCMGSFYDNTLSFFESKGCNATDCFDEFHLKYVFPGGLRHEMGRTVRRKSIRTFMPQKYSYGFHEFWSEGVLWVE